ncbi:unnamed protein product, partial [Meganyctiphanes norvegica]
MSKWFSKNNGLDIPCNWESTPDPAQHKHFLNQLHELILDQAVFTGTSRSSKVCDWMEPEKMSSALSLSLGKEGVTQSQLLQLFGDIIKYSVKTGHPYFVNQLYSSLDVWGLAGQYVTDALNPSVYTYEVSPVFTIMEMEVLSEMAKYVGYEEHDGLFSPGGSMSNLYGILLARYHKFPKIKEVGASQLGRLVAFTSIDSHYSIKKAAMIMGIGTENLVLVNVDEGGRMDVAHLKECIARVRLDGGTPFFVTAVSGTTVIGAYDPVEAIAKVCSAEGLWLHVDAAWGGGALISDKYKYKLKGIHRADSLTWNPHKLLAAPQQCSVFLTKHKGKLEECNSAKASYLFQKLQFVDAQAQAGGKYFYCGKHKVKVFQNWFGSSGLEKHIDRVFELAFTFRDIVVARPGFELVLQPECTNVCFWFIPPSLRNKSREDKDFDSLLHTVAPKIKERMVKSGKMMITYQPVRGMPNFFRFVLQNSCLTEQDLKYFIDTIEELGSDL